MTTTTREQAVKGAGERLSRLEDGIRKLFYLAIATTVLTSIAASLSLFGAYRYWQVTTNLSRSLDDYRQKVVNSPEIRKISRQP
jgi:hypothetical protein